MLEEIKECIVEIFGDDIDVSSINEESVLKDDLGLNSVGMLSLAVAAEEKFGIEFNNDDINRIKTVKDVINVIEERKSV